VKFINYGNETDAKDSLLKNDISDYFVIPVDYLSSGQVVRYTLARDYEPSAKTVSQIKNFLLSNMLDSSVNPQIVDRVKTPLLLNSVRFEKTGEIAASQDLLSMLLVPLIFAVIFMISIFFASNFLFQSVTEEKENRIIEILLSSVSSGQLLVGKILGLGLAGLGQIAVWLVTIFIFSELAPGIIPALSSMHIPASLIGWALVYFILGYLLFASIFAGIGSIGSTAKEAQGWSTIFVLPAMLPYYFSYFIVTQPESVLSRVLALFPLTSPMAVMMRLPAGTISAWELALSLVLLAGSVVFTMWLASRIFRVFLLMYGKKPAVKDIFRYVREA
jgi:ABC-2 type transport system permease protein